MTWKDKIGYRILDRKLTAIERNLKLSGIEDAHKIGILWHSSELDAYLYISDYLRNTQAIVRNLCYTKRLEPGQELYNTFTGKDLNIFGLPASGKVMQFVDINFDLLLNISTQDLFPLNAITALSKASFKIGWSKLKPRYFDLNIDIQKNLNSLFLVKQQIFYLGQLNKKSKR